MTMEELEEEAYQYDLEHMRDNGVRWYHNVTVRQAYLAGAEPREKRIAELEVQIENLQNYLDTQNSYRECAETWQKLNEAKEIIKNMIDVLEVIDGEQSKELKAVKEAEQFLKE